MRIQLIALAFLLSFQVVASQEKEMQVLFTKYYEVMEQHKVELIDEVFSKKFLKENGGKEEFAKGVKELPKNANKSALPASVSFKKGTIDEIYFAKVKRPAPEKGKAPEAGSPEFIVIKEDGKLKIQGTLSDGD